MIDVGQQTWVANLRPNGRFQLYQAHDSTLMKSYIVIMWK